MSNPCVFPLAVAVILVGAGCGRAPEDIAGDGEADFVGRAVCTGCHAVEAAAWRGSDHDLAIQPADTETVLGNFSGATFEHFGVVTRFLERDGKLVVQTPGEDGKRGEFPVEYTFGVDPLQQYLVEFPRGRLQALPFAWDTRPPEDGGQRWMHLYPHEMIAPDDPLYWTGREQNWNTMCAECHSTQVDLGYDRAADVFTTTWKEIDVACEACHGPGSVHLAQAERGQFDAAHGLLVDLDDRDGAAWVMNPKAGIAKRSKPRLEPPRQPEACGRCHSRRGVIAPEYEFGRPLADTHRPALLEDQLYFADGQIRDEVYVYGSFVQSRMYRAGVSCSDCHEPHSLELLTGDDPDAVCARCHLPSKFASDEHRRHAPGVAGCVDCHMPARRYMVVDDRRDHGFRIPRPDLSERLGTPNACNGCHDDRGPRWAAGAVTEWHGSGVFERPEFATALSAARVGHANEALREVVRSPAHPGIARATALTRMAQPLSGEDFTIMEAAAKDPDPLLRLAAYRLLGSLPGDLRAGLGYGGLSDPVLSVRMEAVLALAPLHDLLPAGDARAFREAAADYRAAYEYTSNRPESLASLGDLALGMGELETARARYEQALALEPGSVVVRANLADIHRGLGNEAEAERILAEGVAMQPENAALQHALGLLLARTGRPDESLARLREAVRLGPGDPRYVYVLGVALNSFGHGDDAVALLESAQHRFPTNFDINWALATIYRDRGELSRARAVTGELLERHPDLAEVAALHRALSAAP